MAEELWRYQNGTDAEDSLTACSLGPESASSETTFLAGRCRFTLGDWAAENAGGSDWVAVKLDSDGNELWSLQGGGSGDDSVTAVATGEDGSIVLALDVPTSSATSSGSSSNSSTTGGESAAFQFEIMKLSGDGGQLWHWKDDDTNASRLAEAIAVDQQGGVLVGGLAFDDAGTDFAACKLDSSGNVTWRWQATTGGLDAVSSIAPANGSFILGGRTTGDFNGTSAGGTDFVAVKLDDSGTEVWRWQDGTVEDDVVEAVVHSDDGSAVLAGHTYGSWSSDNADGSFSKDFAAVMLSSDGKEIWRWQDGTTEDDTLEGAAIQGDGSVVLSGNSGGGFVALRLNASGTEVWRWEGGSQGTEVDSVSSCGSGYDGRMVLAGFTIASGFGVGSDAPTVLEAPDLAAVFLDTTRSVPVETELVPSAGSTPVVIAVVAGVLAVAIIGLTILERWLKKHPRRGDGSLSPLG
ncbi:unnamed protein product [Ectocarpus sp. 12 AP-2014]